MLNSMLGFYHIVVEKGGHMLEISLEKNILGG